MSDESLVLQRGDGQPGSRLIGKAALGALTLLLVGYLFIIARSSYFWLGDFPNHLARATVMADLIFHHGAHFGRDFQYQFMFVPYVLADLALTGLVELLGPSSGAAVWECLTFLSLPCALLFLLRVYRTPTLGQLIGVLIATVLSPDWFFFAGWCAFRMGVSLTLVAVGLAVLLRRQRTIARVSLYALVVVCAYLLHVSALLFIVTAIGVTGVLRLLYRQTTLKSEAILWAPILALLLFKFGFVNQGRLTQNTVEGNGLFDWQWGTLHDKLSYATYEFHRFGLPVERLLNFALILTLGLACVLAVRRRGTLRGWLLDPAVRDCLALAAAFVAMYFVLPHRFPDADFVDMRALAPAVAFLVAAILCGSTTTALQHRSLEAAVLLIATALSAATLTTLRQHLDSQHAWISDYRRIVALVPEGSRVWPVTLQQSPFAMAWSSILIDRNALIPNLYSGDNGNPMLYFRYLKRPYVPQKRWWQVRGAGGEPSPAVDWRQVACDYDLILAEQPWDRRWLGVQTLSIAENSSAMLLRVDKSACQRG